MVARTSKPAANGQRQRPERSTTISATRRPKSDGRHRTAPVAGKAAKAPPRSEPAAADVWPYMTDSWQRGVLFLDALRQRADNMLEHERAGLPPLLDFKYENILDARHFDEPANYALLRILQIGDDCWEDCVDPDKPPVIVIDPRAGHGPGIGGFKHDSEVGMALHEGHPVYFVIFYPEPEPHQTLANVHHALRRFVAEVAARHPGKPPVLYGNCQAGWAVTLLSADCQGLTGPVVLNGAPLSYWAGEAGTNPMRVLGGLTGGAWMAGFISDLGDGRFDGAWLAQNFENLQPEKAIWEKYANLFTNIDTERERFLEFERWWNGYYTLSREEIVAISENLFIGNQLEQGGLRICEGCVADLRRIRNPIVVFASWGDNITPPQQAFGWIPAVYSDTDDLKAAGQRIVYLTNPHVGHLGIFVSARVARLEHRAILESLDEIEALAPGLYEMKIDNPSGDPDCHKPQYAVRFEERKVEDLEFSRDDKVFERVRSISEFNQSVYQTFVGPWIQATANPWTAQMMKWLHPMRTSRYVFSQSFNPWMFGVSALADAVAKNRQPLAPDHPLVEQERALIEAAGSGLKSARLERDKASAALFDFIYGEAGPHGPGRAEE
ncbi:Dihydroxyacid dehydratase/phosphogluconate dehydratase [hydrothermal vent metagenome]|uniref:Dihydroxyacid dehydratase/phosphogluconate dehydratase n=1 Tax=hydrothermal vent metagenome TaxID=652676 RepID=A0A3B0TFH8_9ZZZZ